MVILTSSGCKGKTNGDLVISDYGDVYVKGVHQSYTATGFEMLPQGYAVRVAGGGVKIFSAGDNFSKEEVFVLPQSPVTKEPREIESVFRSMRGMYVVTPIGVYQVHLNKAPQMLHTDGIIFGTRYKSYYERIDNKKKVHQYIGTTFNGIYTKALESDKWTNISRGLPSEPYAHSYRFYEGVETIFSIGGMVSCLVRPLGEIYSLDETKNQWKRTSELDMTFPVEKVVFNYSRDNDQAPELFVSGNESVYGIYTAKGGQKQVKKLMDWGNESALKGAEVISYAPILNINPDSQAVATFRRRTGNTVPEIRSLYVNLDYLNEEKQKVIVGLLKSKQFNGVVINLKDDSGRINYASKVALAKKIKSVRPHPRLKQFMKAIEPYAPYITARVVVFKDRFLQRYNDGQYAIWDKVKGGPWHVNKFEHWVDPYNKDVVDYNIEIAKEIVQLSQTGELRIDEIQLDYARLPADTSRFVTAVCRSKPKDWTRYDMMENFFRRVYKEIDYHVSVDIYGYNAIYEMGNIIGQDAKLISRYIPTICPMYYPSHFGSMYLANRKKSQEYETVYFGTLRANYWVYRGTRIRPYIQGFQYKGKYNKKYMQDQVRAVREANGTGFSIWNAGSHYKDLSGFLSNSFLFTPSLKKDLKSEKEINRNKK